MRPVQFSATSALLTSVGAVIMYDDAMAGTMSLAEYVA
jgi:hypothetical protein